MVEINNLSQEQVRERLLRRIARMVLEGENRGEADLSIALVVEKRMRALNKIYLKKDRVTNVLSFANGDLGLDEVVLCPAAIRRDAERYGILFEKELARALIHGILHVLGYEHEKNSQMSTRMFAKETWYGDRVRFP